MSRTRRGRAGSAPTPRRRCWTTNCKAHELDNLYVVDTSFFPSIGAVNPALTAMANAIRVGEHLLERIGVAAAMATATESRVVYVAGLAQGIALVTFPAASTIFTSPADYGLSSAQYGAMFLPQVVLAITASLLGAGLATRFGSKRLYLAGLAADVVSMTLLVVSWGFAGDTAVAYALLLVATGFLGVGFGLTVPALNTFAAAFHPEGEDRAVLVLNALLGLGTALAPVFVAIFVGLGFWWGLPVLAGVFLVGLLAVSVRLPLRTGGRRRRPRHRARGSRPGSGSSPGSRSCTASARR